MKAYYSNRSVERLVSYLVEVRHPFYFDGNWVEFTANKDFVESMVKMDPKISLMCYKGERFIKYYDENY